MAVEQETTRGQRQAERLEAELAKLDQDVDTAAERIRESLQRQLETVEQNTQLNELAKKQKREEASAGARERMQTLRDDFAGRRGAAIQSTRRALLGSAPADPAKLTAFRDARSRAAALDDPQDAARALQTALDDNDSQLAEAIVARALERGWQNVWRQWPEAADGVEVLAQVQGRRGRAHERMFRFGLPAA